jgi:hypothetical protein
MNRLNLLSSLVLSVLFIGIPGVVCADEKDDFFETKIRPVLAEKCLDCHGSAKQTSGLRLDSRAAMIAGGDSGPVLVPGKKDESLLFQAAAHKGDAAKMPPKNSKATPLDASQVADLGQWIDSGAHWPAASSVINSAANSSINKHWAFQPLKSPPPLPKVNDPAWQSNPVDAYISDRLAKNGLKPSPIADRRTLIRRLSFDLLGLPPAPDEIKAFLADQQPDDLATEKLVDRLLASPHFGERFARHWLDLARYSDTKGYVFQEDRRYPFAFTYRDYVIRAFNEDRPYSQFIIDQIAADKIPSKDDNRHMAAMGYLTVGRRFLNNQADIIDDRIDLIGRSLMGLSIACARCHDHKFDPIPAADYYSLYGVFASSAEPKEGPILETAGQSAKRQEFEKEIGKARAAVDEFLSKIVQEFKNEMANRAAEYLATAANLNFEVMGRGGRVDELSAERNLKPELVRATGFRWSAMLKENKPEYASALIPWKDLAGLKPETFAAEAEAKIKGFKTGSMPAALLAELQKKMPKSRADLASSYINAYQSARPKDPKMAPAESDKPLLAVFESENGLLNFDMKNVERLVNRAERNKLRDLQKKVDSINATHPGAPVRAMVLNDNPQPTEPVIFLRGNPGRPGKKVPRQFLQLVSGESRKPFTNGSGRLELAQAIASPDNPLTARVWVNRVWMYLIGKPLVESPSDFGVRSDPPTHPELLDHLAYDFMHADKWQTKSLIRRIVLSRTYRQSSLPMPEADQKDPENRLVHKANRKRLELEPMRDAILAASGRLDPALYGPSVDVTVTPYTARRTVYALIERQNLDSFFRTFDFAGPDSSSPKRFITTVPQQALFLMNHPFVQEESKLFADRFAEGLKNSPEATASQMAEVAWGRPLSKAETAAAVSFLREQTGTDPVKLQPAWSYGFGGVNEAAGRVDHFLKYPKFTGTAWQFGDSLPNSIGSYNHLTSEGGHVGPTVKTAAIRRWTASEAMTIRVDATLRHPSDKGDGVRGFVVSSRQGILAKMEARNGKAEFNKAEIKVEPGETLDFAVDCGLAGDQSFDSFTWAPVITRVDTNGVAWNARDDFGDRPTGVVPLNAAAQFAQTLLQANAFIYVD